ncbi:TPA: hypothetical protein QDZ84_003496 [Shewanella algae]|uniref:hypothetical protein n=3 Tax=Shewanella algae TaxID=38313 RepID=UPI001C59F449|nr:hypothetical protein [Shewanella algae]HDS1208457.1 hypothetical protein [Shewanella algae]
MRLKGNPLIKVITVAVIVTPLIILVSNKSETKNPAPINGGEINSTPLQTDSETIAALNGYVTALETKQTALSNRLEAMEGVGGASKIERKDVEKLIDDKLNLSSDSSFNFEKKLSEIKKQLKDELLLGSEVNPNQVGDVNNEIPFADAFEINPTGTGNSYTSNHRVTPTDGNQSYSTDTYIWEYPLGLDDNEASATANSSGVISDFWNATSDLGKGLGNNMKVATGRVSSKVESTSKAVKKELEPIRYATLHADSSVHGNTALTPLIGRIERKGKTHDAYPFQVVLGAETLMANGHKLPAIVNAQASGVAIGDQAFSCVRGMVTSITFAFEDGRLYQQKGTFDKPLAVLADKWGNPCIRGVMVNDVEKYIAAQSLAAGMASYGETISKTQQTLVSSGNTSALDITGDAGKLALGSIGSGAFEKTAEIIAKEYDSYYKAIYVPQNTKVSLLINENINIDYIPQNRKINYESKKSLYSNLD